MLINVFNLTWLILQFYYNKFDPVYQLEYNLTYLCPVAVVDRNGGMVAENNPGLSLGL